VSVPELAWEAASKALSSAEISMDQIDAVIFGSAPDAFEGVHSPDLWCAGAVGALKKPYMRINTGGTTGGTAALAGFSHVASGYSDLVLVVAVQRVGESPDAQRILNTIWDPIYEKDLALNILTTGAFIAVRQMELYGITEEQLAKISVKNHQNALRNPYAHLQLNVTLEDVLRSRMLCWPLKLLDVCPRSDGACALIMASAEKARKITSKPAWILGVGSSTDTYGLGDRWLEPGFDLADVAVHYRAAKDAYRMAGIHDPRREIDVAEIYAPFTNLELASYEGLGFCERGKGGELVDRGFVEITGDLPVNPSGGTQAANPIGATGLVRLAEAALQIMDGAGEHQIDGVRKAVATAAGGATQFYSVIVLGKNPN